MLADTIRAAERRISARPSVADDRPQAAYRRDLDGLRGLAIALVAVFHVWFGRVSGGVDLFLVLSGFFFGGKLLRAAVRPAASFSVVPEFIRLTRRLLPALVTVLAAAAVLTILVQPQTRWETFADQSLASLGYFQNWELAATASNYLRAGEAVSPLQHIWSMSVQGQFYIALLVVTFACVRLSRGWLVDHLRGAFILLVGVLTIASFVYAVFAHRADQSTAYYNSFARAWELLLGVLVGALLPHFRCPRWLRTAMAAVALTAVLSCGALLDGAHEFPGPWTLVPVGAAVVLILSAANAHSDPVTRDWMPMPNRVLASRPLVALGAMSYSLYLWHWPLLIFWIAHSDHTEAGIVDGAGVLLLSGLLAYLTTRFVENPLRSRAPVGVTAAARVPMKVRIRRPTIVLASVITLFGVSLTVTSFTWREHVMSVRASGTDLPSLWAGDYPGARALLNPIKVAKLPTRPTVLEASNDLPETTTDGCISDFANPAVINCTYGDRYATRTIALAGGSHAEHWITALDALGRQRHFKVVTYLKMGCPLSTERMPVITGSTIPYPQCHQWVEQAVGKLIADRPDYVFTTTTRPRTGPGDVLPATYVGIWETLSRNGIAILGMRDTPWVVHNGQPSAPADCLAQGGDPVSCGMPRSDVLADRNPTLTAAARFPLLKPLDMSDAVCRREVCRAVEGNVLIYKDSHHISATYMRTMGPELGRQVGAATGWW